MESLQYSKFTGLDRSTDAIDANQLSFLKCENFIVNRVKHALYSRGGSTGWATVGDIWGISGYAEDTGLARVPVRETIIRHRRTAAITYLEKLDWVTSTWIAFPLGASTNFDVGDTSHFAQIGELFVIAAGRPTKLRDVVTGSVTRFGGPPPAAAPTLSNSGTGITGTYRYVYTFVDQSSGWESSPSPTTALYTVSNKTITLTGLETSCAREGVTLKRIYRTIETGEDPFLFVAEIPLATVSYADTLDSLSLGANAPLALNHNPPPSTSYLIESHEGRFWVVDANDPTKLHFSEAFSGSYAELEYFSPDRVFVFPKRITGVASRPGGGLLVFQPPGFGIHEISGRTESEFAVQVFVPKEGTNFKNSIATDGEVIAFWAEDGPAFITNSGVTREISFPQRELLRDVLVREYNGSIFVWTQYSNAHKQFIFHLSVSDSEASGWIDPGARFVVRWVNDTTGELVNWSLDQGGLPSSGGSWYGGSWYLGTWYGGPWV